jgi:hypothetical protein
VYLPSFLLPSLLASLLQFVLSQTFVIVQCVSSLPPSFLLPSLLASLLHFVLSQTYVIVQCESSLIPPPPSSLRLPPPLPSPSSILPSFPPSFRPVTDLYHFFPPSASLLLFPPYPPGTGLG